MPAPSPFQTPRPPAAFICGCGHTGTWLLLAALACHPAVDAVETETHAFHPEPDQEAIEALRARAAAAAAEGRLTVEKTPKHIRALDAIRGAFPGARFLVALRDPFEVTASLMRRKWRFPAACERMRTDQTLADAARRDADVLTYRFEDLCTDPEGTLRRISGFLDLPFDPAMRDPAGAAGGQEVIGAIRAGATGTRAAHRILRADQVARPIALPPARAAEALNARQIDKIARRMRAFNHRHGYEAPASAAASDGRPAGPG